MRTHLWHKTRRSRLATGKKGFSSIVGAIFMVLIVWILASSYFIWTLSENTVYNVAIREKNQLEVDRLNERLSAENVNYTVSDDDVSVEVDLRNESPLSVHITTLWVLDTNVREYGFNDTLNINLKPGETVSLIGTEAIKVIIEDADNNHVFNSWFVTTRGNAVLLRKEKGIILAQVSAGIGSVAMDFSSFKYYNVTQVNSTAWKLSPPGGASGYVLPNNASQPLALNVSLTNYDPAKRNITLYPHSALWMILPTSNTAGGKYPATVNWFIVNVDSNGYIAQSFTPITIPYGSSVSVIFASSNDGSFSTQTLAPPQGQSFNNQPAAVNLMLIGTIGNSLYGQNIPFVSVYVGQQY